MKAEYLEAGAFLDRVPVEIDSSVCSCGNDNTTFNEIKLDCFLLGSFVPAPRQSINQLIAPTGRGTSFKTVWALFNQLGVNSLSGTIFFGAGRQGQVSDKAHATEAPRISLKFSITWRYMSTTKYTSLVLVNYKLQDAISPRDTAPRVAHFDALKLIMPSLSNRSTKTDLLLQVLVYATKSQMTHDDSILTVGCFKPTRSGQISAEMHSVLPLGM